LSAAALRRALEDFHRAALRAIDPALALRRAVTPAAGGGLVVVGEPLPAGARLRLLAVGKAAAAMAAELEALAGAALESGLAVTKDGHGLPLARCGLRETAHPVPDARSEAAGREALALARREPAADALLVALSGGASALWSCPLPGLALADVAALTARLLAAGAPIDELNAVRKHLCELAGGRLARDAAAARIHVLALSDVPGDRLDVIASGPCAPDPTTYADACAAIARRLEPEGVPPSLRDHLSAGVRGERPESPKPGDACFERVRTAILASNATAVAAALAAARAAGFEAREEPPFTGEARDVGRWLVARARAELPRRTPLVLVAGGETTVRVRGDGLGGRSQELALAAALELAGCDGIALLAAGTDGSDGPTDAAGAFADGGTVARARAAGLDPLAALARNDSHRFFAAEGGLLRTGPTRTNVMDLVLIGIAPATANRDYRGPSGS
jgi:glycerate-2-kinase